MSASSRPVTGSGKRALVALAMGALVTPTLLAGTAFAQPVDPSDNACPSGVIDDAGFPDVEDLPADLQLAINCIAAYGVTEGEIDGNYNATGTVSRAQMALFFARIAQYAVDNGAELDLDPTDAGFTDIETLDAQTQDAINILANLGVVQGKQGGSVYDPTARITRAQMASFIARFQEALGEPLPEGPDAFTDDEGSVHEDNINAIAAAGITQGVGGNMFNPAGSTTRGQMARFLARHLEVAVSAGLIPAIDEVTEPTAEITTGAEDIVAGAELAGTFANLPAGATVTVSGAGLTDQAVTVDADGAFTLTLPEDVEAGTQTLSFRITLEDGTELTVDVDIEVAETPTTMLNITATGTGPLTRVANPDTDPSDDRQYTVSGLTNGTTYTVALFSGADVTVSGGSATFTDVNSNNRADRTVPTADITVVNGAAQTANTSLVTVAPVNGTITFTVDGDSANETVVPVVFVDAGATAGELDLVAPTTPNANPKAAAEVLGVGPAVTFVPTEAATGTGATGDGVNDLPITAVDKTANTITTPGAFFRYDDNDTFYIVTGESATTGTVENPGALPASARVTPAQFEAAVSAGDQLDASTVYQRTTDLPSTFVLENLSPAAPDLTVNTGNITATGIPITVTGVVEGATVEVYTAVEATGQTTPDFATNPEAFTRVATITTADDTNTGTTAIDYTISVTGANAGREFSVAVRQLAGGETSAADEENNVAVPAVTETVAPTITDAWVSTDNPVTGLLISADGSSTDVVDLAFSEDMSDALGTDAGTFFRISDGTNVFQVNCGPVGACTLDDNETQTGANTNTVVDDHLRVDLGPADITRISGTGALDLLGGTITITAVSNAFADQVGNRLNLAGSADIRFDLE